MRLGLHVDARRDAILCDLGELNSTIKLALPETDEFESRVQVTFLILSTQGSSTGCFGSFVHMHG